jgi:hypothetical protein
MVYEVWKQQNPDSWVHMDEKELINQENHIMRNKKIMEMEIEEIKKELQENQSLEQKWGEQQKQLCTMHAGEKKQKLAPTTEEEMENHHQWNDISKLTGKN